MLSAWEVLRKNELYSNRQVTKAFWDVYLTLFRVYDRYLNKVHPYCLVKNGFSGASHSYLLESLGIFENLGIISSAGLILVYQSVAEGNEDVVQGAFAVGKMLKSFIVNHASTHSPCYDDHIIDISLAIYLLYCLGEREFVDGWIQRIIQSVAFSYHRMGKYFPIDNDSFEDLVGLTESEGVDRSSLFKMSTLIPILAQWSAALNLEESYELVRKIVRSDFPDCTLQIWYPDQDTDSLLYTQNVSYDSGSVEAPLSLDVSIEEMRDRMKLAQERTVGPEEISACKRGLTFLPILASRHFRTPFLPFYWQSLSLESGSDKST